MEQKYIFYLKNNSKIVISEHNNTFFKTKNKHIKNISELIASNRVITIQTKDDILLIKPNELVAVHILKDVNNQRLKNKNNDSSNDVITDDENKEFNELLITCDANNEEDPSTEITIDYSEIEDSINKEIEDISNTDGPDDILNFSFEDKMKNEDDKYNNENNDIDSTSIENIGNISNNEPVDENKVYYDMDNPKPNPLLDELLNDE